MSEENTTHNPYHEVVSRLIDKEDVCNLLNCGKSTLELWVKLGKFLEPVFLNNGKKALWFEHQVHEWIINNVKKQYGHVVPKPTAA